MTKKTTTRKRALKKPAAQAKPQPKAQSQQAFEKNNPAVPPLAHDPAQLADNMAEAARLWQQISQKLMIGAMENPSRGIGHADPLHIGETFLYGAAKAASNPMSLWQNQMGLWRDHMSLWHDTTQVLLGKETPKSDVEDRRFRSDAWTDSPYFDYLRRSYLINSGWVEKSLDSIDGLDEHTAQKLHFFTRQIMDAYAPSNFLLTNPEVMKVTLESNGDNLVKGLHNMLQDVNSGQGKLRIRMTDPNAFTLGENIAATPGKVVYENDLMQLIQFEPLTDKVYETPLLIVPAWINKYYVLDMREENSLIRWLVEQGYRVFVISWVNPDRELGRKAFADYLTEGPLTALDVIEQICGNEQTSLIGYCLGGTLVAILLSYLRSHGESERIASATYLTTMIDFSDAGELSVFIDDTQLDSLEERMQEQGFLDADDMATTFNMLRANDLIWSFVVNNYLLGKDPFPFDLLYWNSDSTRMPATMHSFYLRNMYQKNLLVKPGGIELLDTPINITKIDTPTYILSTKDDHIAPWKSTYAATQIYDGPIQFTLAQSGHIAGVINPPSKKKYGYWVNDGLPYRADQWLEEATFVQDSWWDHWSEWQQQFAGKLLRPKKAGSKQYRPLEAAPGAYARMRS